MPPSKHWRPADVEQTKAALSIGHTTFYKLLNAGDLERAPSKAGTRITTESVRRYAGVADLIAPA